MSDCQEKVDEKNTQLVKRRVLQAIINKGPIRGLRFLLTGPKALVLEFFQSYANSRQHNRRFPKAQSHAHLSSLQHLPFVENLHGENLVCVSDFDNGDLQEGQQCGLKKLC